MNLKKNLEAKLHEIADVLVDSLDQFDNIGVLAGNSGLALFMFYYSRFTDVWKFSEIGEHVLSLAVDMINHGFADHTFCTGISGFAWT